MRPTMRRVLAAAVCVLHAHTDAATVQLDLKGAIGHTEDNFICVNMDWWPVRTQQSAFASFRSAAVLPLSAEPAGSQPLITVM